MSYLGQLLFEDGRKSGIAIGEERGMERGQVLGTMKTLSALVTKGVLQLKDAAEQANMSEEDFAERMKDESVPMQK